MKYLWVCLCLAWSLSINAQAGVQFMGGITNAKNQDSFITPEGTSHPGYFFGADAALNNGKMYFLIGLQFHRVDFMAQQENSYFEVNDAMSLMKIRVGLGFQVAQFSDKIFLKAKTVGSINAISAYPKDLLDEPYDTFNTGTAGVSVGLELEVFKISVFAEYEKGFFNAVNQVKGTEMDFLSFGIGWRI